MDVQRSGGSLFRLYRLYCEKKCNLITRLIILHLAKARNRLNLLSCGKSQVTAKVKSDTIVPCFMTQGAE